jgi:glycosyltransferase involved in cell wall biosynthesis
MVARRPFVTVGMPVFNGERFIAKAIESVLLQTFSNFELLISDNASTDKTATICLGYAATEPRIKFIKQKSNYGPFHNLRYVTEHAVGTLFVWLAHDDVLSDRYLEKCLDQIQKNERSVLVSTDFRIIDEAGDQIGIESLRSIRASISWERRRIEFFRYPIYSNVFYCVYGVVKTEVIRSVMQQLKAAEYISQFELPVLARLAVCGEILSFPEVLREYRRVSTSLHHTEVAALAEKTKIRRLVVQLRHFGGLIADQLAVMLTSSMSKKAKLWILLRVVHYYVSKFVAIAGFFHRGKSKSA